MRVLTPVLMLLLAACDESASSETATDTVPADTTEAADSDVSVDTGDQDADTEVGVEDEAEEPAPEPEPEPLTPEHFSSIGQAIIDALDGSGDEGLTWGYAGDGVVDEGWLIQTPGDQWGASSAELVTAVTCDGGSDCDPDFGLLLCEVDSDCGDNGQCRPVAASVTAPGQPAKTMCTGHSDFLYDELYLALTEAESFADVSSLDAPDGRFLAALRNGFTYLDNAGSSARVRVLFGQIPGVSMDTGEVLEELTRDVSPYSDLTVHVGAYREGYTSWNHAKIVAADGRVLLQGGHNLWETDYLLQEPVFDLSMRVDGSGAVTAHRFLDQLWDYTCEDHWYDGWTERDVFPGHESDCPDSFDGEAPAQFAGDGARVIAASRLGSLGDNPADDGIIAAIEAAEHTLRFSIQDIGPIRLAGDLALSGWPEDVLRALSMKMADGVDVYMVLSTPGSTPGGGSNSYGNGWTVEEVAQELEEWIEDHPSVLPAGETARGLLCERFNVAPLRFTADEASWDGGIGIANHAKFFAVDDDVFYLGSQNLYVANLAEFGMFVDDAELTAEVLDEMWAPQWEASREGAVSGADAPACSF